MKAVISYSIFDTMEVKVVKCNINRKWQLSFWTFLSDFWPRKKQKSRYMYILEVIRVYTAKTPTKMANKKLLTTTVKSKLKIYRS